jgi:hypothetical protein
VRSSSVVAVLEVVVVVFVVDIQSSRRGICRGGSRRVRNRVERNCYRRELFVVVVWSSSVVAVMVVVVEALVVVVIVV